MTEDVHRLSRVANEFFSYYFHVVLYFLVGQKSCIEI